jgi:hypothetical protein
LWQFDDNSTDTFIEDIKNGTYNALIFSTTTAIHTDDANAEANMVFADANGWIHFVAGPNYAGADGCDITYATSSIGVSDGQFYVYQAKPALNIIIKRKTADANHTTALLLTKLLADANITNLVTATQGGAGNSVLTSAIAHTHLTGGADACDYNVITYYNHDTCDVAVAGKVGGALAFDGNDYIDCNQTFQSTFQDSFTVNIWVNAAEFGAFPIDDRFMFGSLTGNNISIEAMLATPGGWIIFGYQIDGEGIYLDEGVIYFNPLGNHPYFENKLNTWVMLTFVVQKISDTLADGYVYVDGVLYMHEHNKNISMEDFDISQNFYIGRYTNNAPDPFSGSLDEVRIYNRALTPREIRVLAGLAPGKRHKMKVIN